MQQLKDKNPVAGWIDSLDLEGSLRDSFYRLEIIHVIDKKVREHGKRGTYHVTVADAKDIYETQLILGSINSWMGYQIGYEFSVRE